MKDDIYQFLESLSVSMETYLPRLLIAFFIVVLGYLLARLVKMLIRKLILYININMNSRLQSNNLNVDLKSSAAFISATFFWVILTIALLLCIQVLQLDFLKSLFDRIVDYLPNIIAAIVIVFVGIICGRLLSDLLSSAASRGGAVNKNYLSIAIRYFILFISVVIAADQLGIQIDFLIDVIDIMLATLLLGAALAFGLGAQTSVSNILGSFYAKKSHQLGSKITLGDVSGTIVKMSDHAIHLETKSGLVVIPAKIFNESQVTIIREDDEK